MALFTFAQSPVPTPVLAPTRAGLTPRNTADMIQRAYNFSAGPAVLPEPVLAQAQKEMLALPGTATQAGPRASIMEISHRSPTFKEIIGAAEANIRTLLAVPDNYSVLFLQGGGRLQFSMIPMNLLGNDNCADYLVTGTWGKKSAEEATKFGNITIASDGSETKYSQVPTEGQFQLNPKAGYVYYVSNETIEGVQFQAEPNAGDVPLVCDASSDFMHKPLDVSKYGLIYACAQKNIGPAGVTVVIIRDDLLERSTDELPTYMNFKQQADHGSLMNTAPTFAIYMIRLVTDWLLNDIGGLDKMVALNQSKANMLYGVIDQCSSFYEGHAARDCRSLMNVVFRLPSDDLTKKFLAEAEEKNMTALAGHRSVGGIRASIYNAMPVAGVETLRDFMVDFCKKNG